jgi:hypothetical protein
MNIYAEYSLNMHRFYEKNRKTDVKNYENLFFAEYGKED